MEQPHTAFIWIEGIPAVNAFAEFSGTFTVRSSARCRIAVDGYYALYVNERYVDAGPYQDMEDRLTVDEVDLSEYIVPGENRLRIAVNHPGIGNFSYIPVRPVLWFEVREGEDLLLFSRPGMDCRPIAAYQAGEMPRVTGQLSFVWQYDARLAGQGLWQPAIPVKEDRRLQPRPLDKLIGQDPLRGRIVACGWFNRREDGKQSVAEMMQQDALSFLELRTMLGDELPALPGNWVIQPPPQEQTGAYLVVDLGCEEAGQLALELDAPAGTLVDIAYGEHLEDLRVRAFVGGRHFANRYITASGRQQFLHSFTRIAGRYLQLHLSGYDAPVTLRQASIRPTEYPVARRGRFHCADSLHEQIATVSERTLHLCMHEHYEDCPWREQALYGMDSRNQALFGYYAFGEYAMPRACFTLLSRCLKPSGLQELTAPSRFMLTIPSFSMAWVMEAWDYVLYTGDRETAQELMIPVQTMLDGWIGKIRGGLFPNPVGEENWNFYEWSDGMSGEMRDYPPRPDAPQNLFFLLGLQAGARLAAWLGREELAQQYRQTACQVGDGVLSSFWDGEKKLLRTRDASAPAHFAELTQALALVAGIIPKEDAPALRAALADPANGMVACTLSHTLYKYEALLQDASRYGTCVLADISRQWGLMLSHGATSFWETIDGADAFDKAGSLCHGWSSVPLYVYYAYVLGVKPTEPGFAKYTVLPQSCGLRSACGRVPMPGGYIDIKWELQDGRPVVTHTEGKE